MTRRRKALARSKSILRYIKIVKDKTVQMSAGKITICLVWCDYITWISLWPLVYMRAIAAIGTIKIWQMI